ncbi:MAG: hypothetical protein NTU41_12810 [Chloroflexi bacterium]|nr:hypothetical protein [Chloroflexota bacterium]
MFPLEDLISTDEAVEGREYREIHLDEIFRSKPAVFTRFAADVIHRRLQATEGLQQLSVTDFKSLLMSPDQAVPREVGERALAEIRDRLDKLAPLYKADGVPNGVAADSCQGLQKAEESLIVAERKAHRVQRTLFPQWEPAEPPDDKTKEAAELFLAKRLARPYYYGFETLVQIANANVDQLLSTAAAFVERMIYRAELDRDKALNARNQESILTHLSEEYFRVLEQRHRRGTAIRQFIDNLGQFCNYVTYRPNAPIAPGVTGFGLTRKQLLEPKSVDKSEASAFQAVLTNAVAGSVLSVRSVKQGQKGEEKIVFYLNRILCIKYRLPLNYGGWQPLTVPSLIRMMQQPVSPKDVKRQDETPLLLLEEESLE